ARRRGVKLGGRNAQSDKFAAAAGAFAEQMRPILADLEGLSANRVAIILNERGIPSAAGGKWQAVQVMRVRQRLQNREERNEDDPVQAGGASGWASRAT